MAGYNQGITIDGIFFDVPFTAISRQVDFVEKYNKLTQDGTYRREILGVYYDYDVSFGFISNDNLYLSLFNKLTENEEEHTVIIPGVNGDFSFTAQIVNVSDNIEKILTNAVKMSNLKCKFKAVSPIK
jgi:hypothetical protein